MTRAQLILLSAVFSLSALAGENGHKRHHPEISAEQKDCLTKLLGEPGSGERPTKDKMEAAFKSCGLKAPQGPSKGEKPQGEVSE